MQEVLWLWGRSNANLHVRIRRQCGGQRYCVQRDGAAAGRVWSWRSSWNNRNMEWKRFESACTHSWFSSPASARLAFLYMLRSAPPTERSGFIFRSSLLPASLLWPTGCGSYIPNQTLYFRQANFIAPHSFLISASALPEALGPFPT